MNRSKWSLLIALAVSLASCGEENGNSNSDQLAQKKKDAGPLSPIPPEVKKPATQAFVPPTGTFQVLGLSCSGGGTFNNSYYVELSQSIAARAFSFTFSKDSLVWEDFDTIAADDWLNTAAGRPLTDCKITNTNQIKSFTEAQIELGSRTTAFSGDCSTLQVSAEELAKKYENNILAYSVQNNGMRIQFFNGASICSDGSTVAVDLKK